MDTTTTPARTNPAPNDTRPLRAAADHANAAWADDAALERTVVSGPGHEPVDEWRATRDRSRATVA